MKAFAKAYDMLSERPIEYEVGHHIHTIDRMIDLGMVTVSEPYRSWCPGTARWHLVRRVALKDALTPH